MAIALVITFFVKYFNKAMVIFSTDEKNTEKKKRKKNCLHEDDVGKKFFTEENFSYPPSRKIMIRPLKQFIIPGWVARDKPLNFMKRC